MLRKVSLPLLEKSLLEETLGRKILLKNTFVENKKEISFLVEQGRQNALVYLERNRIGQKLNIFEENNLFSAVVDLQKKLALTSLPRRIECYDISHISGKFVYGSMVTFIDGKPAKKFYRLFRCPDQNDDFANHREVLKRRFKRALEEIQTDPKSPKWSLPDLIIVDGGKGQLSSDLSILEDFKKEFFDSQLKFQVEICALAKKEEEVFLPERESSVILTDKTKFLVQRIRDEAHRFAISNNRKARLKTVRKSRLEGIPGVGSKTAQKLLTIFGSVENVVTNLFTNKELVDECVGPQNTKKLMAHFGVGGG